MTVLLDVFSNRKAIADPGNRFDFRTPKFVIWLAVTPTRKPLNC